MKVTSWWKYNPFLHKPVSLEPLVPWGSFFYYGPDPSAGVSYGCYKEPTTDHHVISMIAPEVYSPVCGKPMEFVKEIGAEEVGDFFQKACASHLECDACSTKIYSSLSLAEAPKMYCFACGTEITNMEDKTMGKKKEEIAKKRKEIEEAQAKSSQVKAYQDDEFVDDTEFIGIDEILEKLNEEAKIDDEPMDDHSEEPASEEPAMDESSEPAMDDHSEEPASEAPAVDVDVEVEEPMPAESSEHEAEKPKEVADYEGSSESDDHESESESEESEEDFDLDVIFSTVKNKVAAYKERKAAAEKRKEIRKNVLAKVKARKARAKLMKNKTIEAKKEKLKKIIAEKRAEAAKNQNSEEVTAKIEERKQRLKEIIAQKKAEAAEQTEASDHRVVKDEMGEHEGKVEKIDNPANKDMSPEVQELSKKEREDAGHPIEAESTETETETETETAPAAEASTEAESTETETATASTEESTELRYETLSSVENLNSVSPEDVDMVLFGEETENPTWSVFVKQAPVARIQLQAQTNSEDIRSVFASEDYATDLVRLCSQEGLVETLNKVNAEFWANKVSNKEIADRYRSIAENQIKEEKEKVVSNFKQDFLDSINTVIAGFNKNFYREVGHPLKDSLHNNMSTAGLPDSTAASIIEKSFAEGSNEFFDVLFDKTSKFMDMSKEAKAEIATAILDCNVITPDSSEIQAASLENRLERATAHASLSSNMTVTDRVSIDSDSYKSQLKQAWKRN